MYVQKKKHAIKYGTLTLAIWKIDVTQYFFSEIKCTSVFLPFKIYKKYFLKQKRQKLNQTTPTK